MFFYTFLYRAESGDASLVRELCSDPRTLCQVEDLKHNTALDLCLKHRHMEVAHLLLKRMVEKGQFSSSSSLRTAAAVYG